tara:strand:- start:310 stop:585 length:276 start_codon:yes stop_codon:yes gene_type:complete
MMPRSTAQIDAQTAKMDELLKALEDRDAASRLRVAKERTEADERITKLYDLFNQTLDKKLKGVPGARQLAPDPVEESSDDEEDTRSIVLVK